MRRYSFAVLALAVAGLVYLAARSTVGAAAVKEGGSKISLRVFYAGHAGSDREKDFVDLLGKHFTKVGTGDLQDFKEDQASAFDVVILDYDDAAKAPRPTLGKDYSRPTLTVGIVGARISSDLKLKTGYL